MLIQFTVFLSLALSFTIVYFVIPKIIRVSRIRHLFDVPNHRSAATQATPTLGGIAIFAGFTVSLILASTSYNIDELKYMFAGVIAMLLIGIKDDLIGISAKHKFFIQLVMAIYLVLLGHFRITNLHGILGINEIGYLSGSILSVVAIVGIINSVNLIDGIDGLASGVCLLISMVYGFWFLNAGDYLYALTSFSLAGSLMAFFLYNVFGSTNKIFMGDTGSLILGTVVAVLTIHFNQFNPGTIHSVQGLPAISLAILIVPVIDTIRVAVIRLAQKKSPFSPDMNHIHHNLLQLTNSHLYSSLIIIVVNGLIVLFAFSLIDRIGNNNLFLMLLASGFALAYIPVLILKLRKKFNAEVQEKNAIFALSVTLKKSKA
jgi:UDP-N-acetylmuramyl pentapeptide phosphotransferase/UDP-N-acetylglucosamine-1-phosphate transferase